MDEFQEDTASEPASQDQPTIAETTSGEPSATTATETPAANQEESFIDASTRKAEIMARIQANPELKQAYEWMLQPYRKSRDDLKQGREAAAQINRFYSDLAYQEQILQQVATQRGYQLVRPNEQNASAQPATPNGSTSGQAPQDFVKKIEGRLAPELKWMAQSLADAQWEGIQPLIQERQHETQSKKAQEYEAAASELGSKFPGWEGEEENMSELLGFLQGGSMRHPKFGNRLEVLYKASQLLAGHQGHVVQDYAKRTQEAARSRTVSSNAARPSLENYSDQIRKAPKSSEAFAIATKVAEEELRRAGVNV